MASPAITLSHDRPVGGLDHLPLPPHHSTPTPQRLFRSDSDVSQSSTASSVPRSSSFTRSKRFLTGDGLSAREALGIIDEPNTSAVHTNSITRLHDFHVARAAMHAVLGHGPTQHPRLPPPPPEPQVSAQILNVITSAPPPKPPPPPPLPRQPSLSRLVFGAQNINLAPAGATSYDPSASAQSSPAPQSPESISSPVHATAEPIKMHPFSMSSTKIATQEKPKRRMRRILSSTGARQKHSKTANLSAPRLLMNPAQDASKAKSSSQTSSVQRSKTFARLLAFFSSPGASSDIDSPDITSNDSKVVHAKVSHSSTVRKDRSNGSKRVEARSVSSPRMDDRSNLITPKSHIGKAGAAHQVSTTSQKVSNAAANDKGHTVYTSDEDSSLSNIADMLVKERPLFRMGSQSHSNTAGSEENSDAAHDEDKHSVAKEVCASENDLSRGNVTASCSNVEKPSSPLMHRDEPLDVNVEPGVAPQKTGSLSQPKTSPNKQRDPLVGAKIASSSDQNATPERGQLGAVQAAVKRLEMMEKNASSSFTKNVSKEQCAPTADDNLSFTSAAEDFGSTKEAEINKENTPKKTTQGNVENEKENSPQPSVESPTVESMTPSSSGNSRADRYCEHPGTVANGSDSQKFRSGDAVKFPDARANEITRPFGQFGLPILHNDVPAEVNAHAFLDGPIVNAVIEEGSEAQKNRRDSHVAFLRPDERPQEVEQVEDLKGAENKPAVDYAMGQARKGVRKTKSGLSQRIAATAKKLPRGASFPRLRSWGDQSTSEGKPGGRTMSLSKNVGKEMGGRSPSVAESGRARDFASFAEKTRKEENKDKPSRGDPGREAKQRETGQRSEERNCTPISQLRGSGNQRNEEGSTFSPSRSEKQPIVPSSNGKKKPHEDMLCISKLAVENFAGEVNRGKRETTFRRPLPRPKTIAHGMRESMNKAGVSVKGAGQEPAKLGIESTREVVYKGAQMMPATCTEATASKIGAVEDCIEAEKQSKGVEVAGSKESADSGMVTVERVIRRIKADGSSETIRKKIRLRAERVLPNGDVVVRRKLQRLKEDGSGSETVTILQVIPRRKKTEAVREGGDDGREGGEEKCVGTSLPDLETVKRGMDVDKGGEQGKVEKDRANGIVDAAGGDGRVGASESKDGKLGVGGWGRMWSFQGKDGARRRFWRR